MMSGSSRGRDKIYTLRSRFVPAESELCCGNYLEYVCGFLSMKTSRSTNQSSISQVKKVNKEVVVQFHLAWLPIPAYITSFLLYIYQLTYQVSLWFLLLVSYFPIALTLL